MWYFGDVGKLCGGVRCDLEVFVWSGEGSGVVVWVVRCGYWVCGGGVVWGVGVGGWLEECDECGYVGWCV